MIILIALITLTPASNALATKITAKDTNLNPSLKSYLATMSSFAYGFYNIECGDTGEAEVFTDLRPSEGVEKFNSELAHTILLPRGNKVDKAFAYLSPEGKRIYMSVQSVNGHELSRVYTHIQYQTDSETYAASLANFSCLHQLRP